MAQLDRQIGILTILLRHKRVTAGFLADRFDVSVRTIQRDLDSICRAGIPLVTLQGPSGGVEIMNGYCIERSVFTADELETLICALKGTDSVLPESYTERLLEKLSDSGGVPNVEFPLEIDLSDHNAKSLTDKIHRIREAISRSHCIRFSYSTERGETFRTVEPYRLLFRWGKWYLFAYCRLREGYRLFKLQRLWSLEVQEETFVVRADALEARDWDDCFNGDIELVALFDASVRYRLVEEYDPSMLETTVDGRLLFRFRFAFSEHLISWLLSFGSHVEILEPDEIRGRVLEESNSLIKRNNHDRLLS